MATDYNQKMQFPTNDNFVNRITGAEFKESKTSGNPMIALTMEVVSPETVDIGGKEVNIAGVETISYYTVTSFKNGEEDVDKTAKNRERLEELYTNLGLDFTQVNFNNPDVAPFKGLVVLTAMGCENNPQHKTPTAEQLAKGQKVGDVMKNPVTGKELFFYKPNIKEIFGIAPAGVAGTATASKPY